MINKYDLSGNWNFEFDKAQDGEIRRMYEHSYEYADTMYLPSTTAIEKKGTECITPEIWHLAEVYPFAGAVWFEKKVRISPEDIGRPLYLYMNRTRMTRVWVDGVFAGENNSLCAPHTYDITKLVKSEEFSIAIEVKNICYPTGGGHMTSPDTQTNWIGITGDFCLISGGVIEICDIKTYPDIYDNVVRLRVKVNNHTENIVENTVSVTAEAFDINGDIDVKAPEFESEVFIKPGMNEYDFEMPMGDDTELWSEHNPVVYRLEAQLCGDTFTTTFGMRDFKNEGLSFKINGRKTFLRGKHDGMLFPLTGAAPTDVDEWIRILEIAKSYGINHYRYHTSCPPTAAFEAADLVGIYMEPQLPFWGTLAGEGDENYEEQKPEQEYLISEGERILEAYGNHPSFCMMSLGNELWGSEKRLAEILRKYKAQDDRHLYSQGSNNYQWCPKIFEEDDYFVGVRFDISRQIRGSYAQCDAPLGFIQTQRPATNHNYDDAILPKVISDKADNLGGEIEIQYGTGVKKVKAESLGEVFVPSIPVVTHEIGQYGVFPNFNEIKKYTGVTRAANFEIFRDKLEKAGMLDMAEKFFKCSGALAVNCYKEELEAAVRSENVSGYQILDIQDFNGQGTALVGILDSFMDSKGLITDEGWREFCSDAVVMAHFDKFNFKSGEKFYADISLAWYREYDLCDKLVSWCVKNGNEEISSGILTVDNATAGLNKLGSISFDMPEADKTQKLLLEIKIKNECVKNHYDLWVYPEYDVTALAEEKLTIGDKTVYITEDFNKAKELLADNQKVLLLQGEIEDDKKIKGAYCTDFWNFPMFSSISRSMQRPIPVGTMGMVIDNTHPAVSAFATDCFTTQQWFDIVENADCAILDDTDIKPIIQMIDNADRNHKLGILFETTKLGGKLLVCTSRLLDIPSRVEVSAFAKNILDYIMSDNF